jgi:acetyl-CoA carboxylase carboxyl transferase subunit alpha
MIAAMGQLTVPNLVVFLGEGHSGGALAFANANRIIMLDDALFNVASPEAVTAILHGQQTVSDAIDLLPMTADALQARGLVDQIIAHDQADLITVINQTIERQLAPLQSLTATELIAQRERKFRQFLDSWPVN